MFNTPGRTNMNPTSPLYAIALRWMQENGELFSKDTLQMYDRFLVNQIIPYFGDSLHVTEEEIRAFMDKKREEGIAGTTVYRM